MVMGDFFSEPLEYPFLRIEIRRIWRKEKKFQTGIFFYLTPKI
jgi:hypothetical protein